MLFDSSCEARGYADVESTAAFITEDIDIILFHKSDYIKIAQISRQARDDGVLQLSFTSFID